MNNDIVSIHKLKKDKKKKIRAEVNWLIDIHKKVFSAIPKLILPKIERPIDELDHALYKYYREIILTKVKTYGQPLQAEIENEFKPYLQTMKQEISLKIMKNEPLTDHLEDRKRLEKMLLARLEQEKQNKTEGNDEPIPN